MNSAEYPPKRLKSLDLLRLGLCLLIMVTHTRRIFEIHVPVFLTKGPFDGKGGVVLFFVLSGYVLTKSLAQSRVSWDEYRHYIIRRVFRLFPLYWTALVLTWLILTWIKWAGGLPEAEKDVIFLAEPDTGWRQWLLHFTLVVPGMQADFALPTVWSLMTESKVSLLAFPFLGWAILRFPLWGALGMTFLFVLGSDFLDNHIIGTAAYLGMFCLGGLLGRVPESRWRGLSTPVWWCLLLVGIAVYSCMTLRYQLPNVWMGYYLCAFGAVAIIACVSFWPALSKRMHAVFSFVGVDMSYGIYLLHYPVLLAFFKLGGSLGLVGEARWVPAFAAMVVTVALAWVLAHLVEIPMVRLGRQVAGAKKNEGRDSPAVRDVSS